MSMKNNVATVLHKDGNILVFKGKKITKGKSIKDREVKKVLKKWREGEKTSIICKLQR